MNRIQNILCSDAGATSIEYAAIASIISIAAIAGMASIGSSVAAMFASVSAAF